MKVLVACEFSQVVTKAFREQGHEAYSCDILPTEGNQEWHIQDDVFNVTHKFPWDMMIAHPPCTYLAWSGERWLKNNPERQEKRLEAFEFLKALFWQNIPMICIEQSLSYFLERNWLKPNQKVHPFHFGDPYRKTTCFWLRGLRPLIPTNIVWNREPAVHNEWPGPERKRNRSRTYPGIAKAIGPAMGIN